jgi:hypothetical protein
MKHHEHTRAEIGKVLCHTSPEGLASYYLLFGYLHAAEAVCELPRAERAKIRAALLEDVLATRTKDGGFCDNPVEGRPCGAAMALETIRLLREKEFR